jgi:hypothetical protein
METVSPSLEPRQLKTPEEERDYLRDLLASKEKEIANLKSDNSPEALTHEALKEYKSVAPEHVLASSYQLGEKEVASFKVDLSPEEHDDQIAKLATIVGEHGVKNALTVAEQLNNPHIMDDLERFLVQYLKAGYPLDEKFGKTPEFRALNMTLFEVTLPEKTETGQERPLKEVLASMEQFYSGMLSVDDKDGAGHFTIELAVSNDSDDYVFYVAVPDAKKSLFEKMLLSTFNNAKIVEKKDDYNIFSSNGVTVAAEVYFARNAIYPIKTYEQFDHDPLNFILNGFEKIKAVNEGAAIQLLCRPKDDEHTKRFNKIIADVLKGENIDSAITQNSEGAMKYVASLFKGVDSLVQSQESKDKADAKKKERAQSVDQTLIETLKHKVATPILISNIRIVVSAESETKADQILSDIEASFNQFYNPQGNSFNFRKLTGKALKVLLYNFSFRLFSTNEKLLLNISELSSVLHFPANVIKSAPHLKTAKSGSAPAPLGIAKEGILIGLNRDRNVETKVYMAPEDRLRHLYTIGQTGTGKTTLLKNMIAQDILNGEGVCFIDPHGSDIEDILSIVPPERYKDVIYFDPGYTPRPMALNMLEYDTRFPEQKTFVVNEMLSIFNKLFDMKVAGGPMFEQYFRNATMLVIEDPESGNTLVEVSRVLSNKAFRDMKLEKCKNPIVVQFWKEVAEKAQGEVALANIVPYITSKFDVFLSNDIMRPIIAQEKSVFNFRQIMDEKKILLVNLSKGRLGDINANLIGLILVGKILMAALSRVDSIGKDLPPFYLYIDEFQNVTTDSIATILSEARKYKLSLTIAHQFIAQLEEKIRDAVFGNVGSIAAFRVGSEDAEFLEKQFAPVFNARDLQSLDNRNAYMKMLAYGRPVKPFNIETLLPPQGERQAIESLKDLSYMTYGRDRAEVEKSVMDKFRAIKPDTKTNL